MMGIDSYFSNLTLFHIAFWVVTISFGEIIGAVIASRLNAPTFTRPFWWTVGLMLYVNIWFLISPFAGYRSEFLLLLASAMLVVFATYYLKDRLHKSLNKVMISVSLCIVTLLPLATPLWIKLSLPPYFADEIGYHYYSPIEIERPDLTERRHNLYFYLPQSLDNLYRISFAITKSYTVARLLHLSIVVSGLLVVATWLRKYLGILVYLLWCIFCWYVAANFVSMATNGLVDMATASTVLVAILVMIDSYKKNNVSPLLFLGVVWGMAISFKYSAIVPLLGHGLFFLIQNLQNIRRKKTMTVKNLVLSVIVFVVFGGFWFLRNLYLTGELIYKIDTGNLFSGWTVPLWPFDLYKVSKELFIGNYYFSVPLIIGVIMLLWQYRYIPKAIWYLVFGWFTEVVLVAYLGGFVYRYYFHWIYIAFVVMLSVWSVFNKKKILVSIYFFGLLCFLIVNATHVINFVHSNEFTPEYEKDYASGSIGIDDWLKRTLGDQYELTKWCSGPNVDIKTLHIADPNIMWVTRNGDFQGFLVNCRAMFMDLGFEIDISGSTVEEYSYIVSTVSCTDQNRISDLLFVDVNDSNWVELEQYPYAIKQRSMNNELVCKGNKVLTNLYRIPSVDLHKIVNTYR